MPAAGVPPHAAQPHHVAPTPRHLHVRPHLQVARRVQVGIRHGRVAAAHCQRRPAVGRCASGGRFQGPSGLGCAAACRADARSGHGAACGRQPLGSGTPRQGVAHTSRTARPRDASAHPGTGTPPSTTRLTCNPCPTLRTGGKHARRVPPQCPARRSRRWSACWPRRGGGGEWGTAVGWHAGVIPAVAVRRPPTQPFAPIRAALVEAASGAPDAEARALLARLKAALQEAADAKQEAGRSQQARQRGGEADGGQGGGDAASLAALERRGGPRGWAGGGTGRPCRPPSSPPRPTLALSAPFFPACAAGWTRPRRRSRRCPPRRTRWWRPARQECPSVSPARET